MTQAVPISAERTALSLYVIVCDKPYGLELLRVSLQSGEEALPVFSSEEAARRFLPSGAREERWRVRWCSTGELISLLFALGANVERVLLDPLPGPLAVEDEPANPVYRDGFIASLLGSRGSG